MASSSADQRASGAAPRWDLDFDGIKVFSATMFRDREQLGELVTAWLAARPSVEIADIVVRQSSDSSFHCLSVIVFYREHA